MQTRSPRALDAGASRSDDAKAAAARLGIYAYEEFRSELTRAELAGEISELQALSLQAILAMAEESELASDYLEMAEVVATSPEELAIVAENWSTYELLHGEPLAAAHRCLSALDHVYQTEGLWRNLMIALYQLGDMETLDAMLRRFAGLDDELTTRLVKTLCDQPILREVHARPAFRELLDRRATRRREAAMLGRVANQGVTPTHALPGMSSPQAKPIPRSAH
jgi:hypothetical protein